MDLIADILLGAGALGAGVYCFVLARRLARFTDLDNGMGAAVALLSRQVDEMSETLRQARSGAAEGAQSIQALTRQADAAANRLELLVASLHALPQGGARTTPPAPEPEATFLRHSGRDT